MTPRKPINAARTRPHWSRKACSRVATTPPPGALQPRRPSGLPGSATPARSQRRGRRPHTAGSRASLISTNGPSVVRVLPSCTRTVVPVSGASSPRPGGDARGRADRLVVGVDGLLLVLRKGRPLLRRPGRRGCALMDEQHVLHRSSFSEWSHTRRTGSDEIDSRAKERTIASFSAPKQDTPGDLHGGGSATGLRRQPRRAARPSRRRARPHREAPDHLLAQTAHRTSRPPRVQVDLGESSAGGGVWVGTVGGVFSEPLWQGRIGGRFRSPHVLRGVAPTGSPKALFRPAVLFRSGTSAWPPRVLAPPERVRASPLLARALSCTMGLRRRIHGRSKRRSVRTALIGPDDARGRDRATRARPGAGRLKLRPRSPEPAAASCAPSGGPTSISLVEA